MKDLYAVANQLNACENNIQKMQSVISDLQTTGFVTRQMAASLESMQPGCISRAINEGILISSEEGFNVALEAANGKMNLALLGAVGAIFAMLLVLLGKLTGKGGGSGGGGGGGGLGASVTFKASFKKISMSRAVWYKFKDTWEKKWDENKHPLLREEIINAIKGGFLEETEISPARAKEILKDAFSALAETERHEGSDELEVIPLILPIISDEEFTQRVVYIGMLMNMLGKDHVFSFVETCKKAVDKLEEIVEHALLELIDPTSKVSKDILNMAQQNNNEITKETIFEAIKHNKTVVVCLELVGIIFQSDLIQSVDIGIGKNVTPEEVAKFILSGKENVGQKINEWTAEKANYMAKMSEAEQMKEFTKVVHYMCENSDRLDGEINALDARVAKARDLMERSDKQINSVSEQVFKGALVVDNQAVFLKQLLIVKFAMQQMGIYLANYGKMKSQEIRALHAITKGSARFQQIVFKVDIFCSAAEGKANVASTESTFEPIFGDEEDLTGLDVEASLGDELNQMSEHETYELMSNPANNALMHASGDVGITVSNESWQAVLNVGAFAAVTAFLIWMINKLSGSSSSGSSGGGGGSRTIVYTSQTAKKSIEEETKVDTKIKEDAPKIASIVDQLAATIHEVAADLRVSHVMLTETTQTLPQLQVSPTNGAFPVFDVAHFSVPDDDKKAEHEAARIAAKLDDDRKQEERAAQIAKFLKCRPVANFASFITKHFGHMIKLNPKDPTYFSLLDGLSALFMNEKYRNEAKANIIGTHLIRSPFLATDFDLAEFSVFVDTLDEYVAWCKETVSKISSEIPEFLDHVIQSKGINNQTDINLRKLRHDFATEMLTRYFGSFSDDFKIKLGARIETSITQAERMNTMTTIDGKATMPWERDPADLNAAYGDKLFATYKEHLDKNHDAYHEVIVKCERHLTHLEELTKSKILDSLDEAIVAERDKIMSAVNANGGSPTFIESAKLDMLSQFQFTVQQPIARTLRSCESKIGRFINDIDKYNKRYVHMVNFDKELHRVTVSFLKAFVKSGLGISDSLENEIASVKDIEHDPKYVTKMARFSGNI